MTTSPDFYPTLLEMAGLALQPQQHVDGISLLTALSEKKMEERPVFWHYPHYGNQGGTPGSSVRYGKWKLSDLLSILSHIVARLRMELLLTQDT